MRYVLAVIVLALLGPASPALAREDRKSPKPSSVGEVLARLSLDDPAEVAWGCYLAGRDGHEQAVPQIVDVLRRNTEKPGKTWRLVHRAAIDALIRLEAPVSPALLALHDRWLPIHVLVIRARDPRAHVEAILARFVSGGRGAHVGMFCVAHGNLLLQLRAEGFASALLGMLHSDLEVRVRDPDTPFRGGTRSMGGGSGDAVAKVPEGFPPYAWYGLHGEARSDTRLLADGPRPIHVQRRERATPGLVGGGANWRLERTDVSLEWIARLLGVEDIKSLGFVKKEREYHTWVDAATYLDGVTKVRDAVLATFWTVARRLRDADLLTLAEVREAKPSLRVRVNDRRKDKRDPIPDLPAATRPAWTEENPR